MTSSLGPEDVGAEPGVLRRFSTGEGLVTFDFTKIGGENYTGLSLKLPKRSNAINTTLDISGSLYNGTTMTQEFRDSDDWKKGVQNPAGYFMHDSSGFHLDGARIPLFENEQTLGAGSEVMDVARGDFNDDGRDDLVCVNRGDDTATVFIQDSSGKLVKNRTLTTGDAPTAVGVGDLDDDGRDDFAVGCYGGQTVEVFTSNANGTFNRTTETIGMAVYDLEVGDLNSDDLDDIVVTAGNYYGIVLEQGSTGWTTVFRTQVTTGGYYYYTYYARCCAIGDFNNDGRNDVTFTASTSYTWTYAYQYYGMVKVYYQDIYGDIQTYNYRRYYAYNYAYDIDAGDVTGDGLDDIVFSNYYINDTRVLVQLSGGNFAGPTLLNVEVGNRPIIKVADVNGKGKNETLVVGQLKKLALLTEKGGAVDGSVRYSSSWYPLYGVEAGDFNGDGLTDVATADYTGRCVGLWFQRARFSGTWRSNAIVQPAPIKSIHFNYTITDNGGQTSLRYSLDNTNWTLIEHDTTYEVPGRPDRFWIKLNTSTTSLNNCDAVRVITMDITYSSYPMDVSLDVGGDGTIDWTLTGELSGTTVATGFEDAITRHVQDPDRTPDPQGNVLVPLVVHSSAPGHLKLSGLYITYNNASDQPTIRLPSHGAYVNATPTFSFQAKDNNDDRLRYVLQLTRTNFDEPVGTMLFDMRISLYDQVPGEGFSQASFPQGTIATFTLPEVYGLEMNTTYMWRVLAFDGYLLSEPSETRTMKVDSAPPICQMSSPRFSNTSDFVVLWSAKDPSPGAGLAAKDPYDVQYRVSGDDAWTDWFKGSRLTSATFYGEDGVTYHFRVRARDAVYNTGRWTEGEGDTTTTVDTSPPSVEVLSPREGHAVITGTLEIKVNASDTWSPLDPGRVQYNLDDMGWMDLPRVPGFIDLWRHLRDVTTFEDGRHILVVRATDLSGKVTEVTVAFFVDNHDPTCEIVSPEEGRAVVGRFTFKALALDDLGIAKVEVIIEGLPGLEGGLATYNVSSSSWDLVLDTTVVSEGRGLVSMVATDSSGRRSAVAGPRAFTVDNDGPRIQIVAPGVDEYLSGSTTTVEAFVEDLHFDPDTDEVHVRVDGGSWTLMTRVSDGFLYTWAVGDVEEGEHEVTVRAMDQIGHQTQVSITALVDRSPPVVDFWEPGEGQHLSGDVSIVPIVEDAFPHILMYRIDSQDWIPITLEGASFDSGLFANGAHLIRLRAIDRAGAETERLLRVTFDNTPPSLEMVDSPDMGAHVARSVPFIVEARDGIGIASVKVTAGGLEYVLNSLDGSDRYVFNLVSEEVDDGELQLEFIAEDPAGNRGRIVWTVFVDNSPPTIDIILPKGEARDVIRFEVLVSDDTGVSMVRLRIGDAGWIPMVRGEGSTYHHEWDSDMFDNGEGLEFHVEATDTLDNSAQVSGDVDVANSVWALVAAIALVIVLLLLTLVYLRRNPPWAKEEIVAEPEDEATPEANPDDWVMEDDGPTDGT